MRRTTVSVGSLSLVLLATLPAGAQGPRDRARAAVEQAQTHAEGGRHALAAQSYLEAYEHMTDAGLPNAPLVLWNAGDQLAQIPGREQEAIDTLRRFLEESSALADEAAQVRDWRSNALSLLDDLEARASPDEPPEASEPATPRDPSEHLSPIGPIVLGVGIAGLGVGGVFGALALVDESNLLDECGGTVCTDTEDNRSRYSQMRTFAGVSDAFLIGGALVAVTGFVLLFALDPDTSEDVSAEAACTPLGCWAGIEGSF